MDNPTRSRMLGAVRPSTCPVCRVEPGPDCTDKGKSRKQQRRREHAEIMRIADEQIARWQGALDSLAEDD